MKKSNIHIGVLLALTPMFSMATPIEDLVKEPLEILVTGGSLVNTDVSTSSSKIQTLSSIDLKASGATTLTEALAKLIPNYDNYSQGTKYHSQVSRHGGLSSKYVLLLVDGVPVPQSTSGGQTMPQIPMQMIEYVEYISGGSSIIYGSNAVSGVLNIVTKKGGTFSAGTTTSYGSNNTSELGGYYADSIYGVDFAGALSYESSDGYDFNGSGNDFGYETYKSQLNAKYETDVSSSLVSYSNNQVDVDFWDYSGVGKNITNYEQLSIQHDQALSDNFKVSGLYAYTVDSLESINSPESYKPDYAAIFETTSNRYRGYGEYSGNAISGLIGAEYVDSDYFSTDNYASGRTQRAAFGRISFSVTQALTLESGVRYDSYSDFGDSTTYSFGASYVVNEALQLKASHWTSFAAPSANDLYYPNSGNPNLKSESGKLSNLTAIYTLPIGDYGYQKLSLSADVGTVSDQIAWAPDTSGSWKPFNVSSVDVEYYTAQYTVTADIFKFDSSYTRTETKDSTTGLSVPYSPKNKYKVNGSANVLDMFILGASYTYYSDRLDSYGAKLDSFDTVSLYVETPIGDNVFVKLSANDLTSDEDDIRYTGYRAQGPTYFLMLDSKF